MSETPSLSKGRTGDLHVLCLFIYRTFVHSGACDNTRL